MLVKLQTPDYLIYAELDRTERVTHLATKNRIPVQTCYAILWQEDRIFLFYTTHLQKLSVKSLNLTVSYADSMKKQYKDSFFLEFNKWIGFYQRANDPLNKIVSELDGIRRKLR